MKNLKKVLAFAIVFAMMLSMAVSAGTLYPDVDDAASYTEAVATLKALGIMEGDDKGNFNPDASIVRAETAAIVARVRALTNAAAGKSTFTDVPADHWAAGYINLAEQSKIINGYGDGTFGPSDPVTYEQVIKMIVAALGYTPKAEIEGGYPSGYLTIASQKDILKGVSVKPGEAAPRSAVARMIFNALEVNTMEQITFKEGEAEYQEVAKTLLNDYLKVDKYEGVVVNTYATAAGNNENEDITIDVAVKNGVAYVAPGYILQEGNTDATGFLGMYVAAYAEIDDITGKETLLGIAAKANKNNTLELDYSDVENYDSANFVVEYVKGTGAIQKAKLNKNAAGTAISMTVFKNGAAGAVSDLTSFLSAPASGVVKFVDNNNDSYYDVAFVTAYGADYVVAEINANAKVLTQKDGTNIPVYLNNEAYTTIFRMDGAQIALEDIQVGDVITIARSGNLINAYVARKVVEGSVTSKTGTGVDALYTIGGEKYRSNITVATGDEGKFYLNVDNRIVAKDATSVAGNYGFLYNAWLNQGGGSNGAACIKFLGTDGEWQELEFAKKVTIIKNGAVDADIDAKDGITGFFSGTIQADDSFATITRQLFQYRTNAAGEINKIWLDATKGAEDENNFSFDGEVTSNKTYSASQNKLGNIYFNDETIVISIPNAITEEKDIKLTKVSSIFVDDKDYNNVKAYDYVDGIPTVIVVQGAEATIVEDTKLFLVTEVVEVRDDNEQDRIKLIGYQAGEEVEALIAEDGATLFKAGNHGGDFSIPEVGNYVPAAGDAILFSLDADGAINNVELLFSKADATFAAGDVVNAQVDGLYAVNYYAHASKKMSGGSLELGTYAAGATEYTKTALTTLGGDAVSLKLNGVGANFYEVNLKLSETKYTADFDYSMIETVVEETVDTHWVFVRVYDDVVTDVIAYRTEVPAIPAP